MINTCKNAEFSLREIIDTRKTSIETFLKIAISIVNTLSELQHKGINNYILTPENTIITKNDKEISARLINRSSVKKPVMYMSPEETGMLNYKSNFRKDFYTLGIIYYELLTGHSIIKGEDSLEIIYSHLTKQFEEPSGKNRRIPQTIWEIIKKLLNKNPLNRYLTYNGLKADLEKCLYQLQHLGFVNNFILCQRDIASNLIVPNKYFGKKFLNDKLVDLCNSMDDIGHYMLIIRGEPGTGKSSVIKELKKTLIDKNDYYINLVMQKNCEPMSYFFVMEQLRGLIKRILMENEESIVSWRFRFINALGSNINLIIEYIPELKLILGNDYEVENIIDSHIFFRLRDICEKIIEIFTENNHIFMVTFDNAQWIDAESLNFIKSLLRNPKIKNLLLVCTWLDVEDNLYDLSNFIEIFNEFKVKFKVVEMEPLSQSEIKELLLDCYSNSIDKIDELANIIRIKTQGNLYFINKFIKNINESCIIEYDCEKNYWEWNVEQVSRLPGKERLFNSINKKIQELPKETVNFLKTACCFRDKFSISVMSKIFCSTTSEMMDIVSICIKEELIFEIEPGKYVFSDKKVIQALTNILTLDEKQNIFLKIARCIAAEYTDNDSKIKLYDLIYYFNMSREKLSDEREILYFIRLNYEGGLSAYKVFAYKEAAAYFDTAVSYVDMNFWSNNYELAYDIFLHAIDSFYSNVDFEKGDYYSEILFHKSKSRIDKCRIYSVKIKQYTRRNKIQPAIDMAYKAINLMESSSLASYSLNKKNSREEFTRLVTILKNKDIMKLGDLPENVNIEKRILMEIYGNIWILGYISRREKICFAAAVRMLKISNYYGNIPGSAFGYVCFGAALMDAGEHELGSRFGKLALSLNQRHDNAQLDCQIKFVYALKICFYTESLKKSADYLKESYNSAVKCGDFIYSAASSIALIYLKFIAGQRLHTFKPVMDKALNSIEHKGSKAQKNLKAINHVLLKLMGFETENYDLILKDNSRSWFEFAYYTCIAMQSYILEEYETALKYLDKIKSYLRTRDNNPVKMVCYYLYALTSAALFTKSSDNKYKIILNQMNERIKSYQSFNCKNGLCMLIQAETSRASGDETRAMQLYEQTLNQAEDEENNHLAAFCSELAFKFYLSKNIKRAAFMSFNYCVKYYEYWGVKAKADKLRQDYKGIFCSNIIPSHNIDLNALFKSAQIIANEMDYNRLIKKIIRIAMERAGAERCCFITEKNSRLNIIADTTCDKEVIELFSSEIPLEKYIPVLKTVIYYVSRSKETVVIDDAKKSEFYYGEKYINENNVKSVLCIPICCNNKIKSILYFENNIINGAFNQSTTDALKLLTVQAATFMENAAMYNSIKEMNEKLENTVNERTWELESTINMLKQEAKERKVVEEALLESESRLRTLINNTSDCITFKDGSGRYVEINEAALQLLGLEEIDYRNKTNLELNEMAELNKETFRKIDETDRITFHERKEMRFSQKLTNGKGEENYFDIIKSPVFNSKGENRALVVIARNITEKEKAEELRQMYSENARKLEEVMEYDKMRTEFIANISHELRTPLNVILSSHQMCELILNSQKCTEIYHRLNKYMGMTKQNCYRLLRLINNLIDITKIDSGYLTPEFIMGDIVNFIEGITMSVVTFAESRGITIVFDTQAEEKYIPFDRDKIERIMLNLLSNAIKFTPANGSIYVNLYDFYDKISISVKDTGIGIPEEKKAEIFKRFVQLDMSFSRENEGSGIGLALVKSLVDMHNGEITVRSECGKGSEFIVTLPAVMDENLILKEEKAVKDSKEEKIERVRIEFSDIYL